jgi:uncharacterized protein (DUF1330 family)
VSDRSRAARITSTTEWPRALVVALAFGLCSAVVGCGSGDDDSAAAATHTPSPTPTATHTPTVSSTPTATHTPTVSSTPTATHTSTVSPTPTATHTSTVSPTPTATPDPVEDLIARLVADGPSYGQVNPDQLRRMLTIADDGPLLLFTLLRYREHAQYPDGSDADRTGREAAARYEAALRPILSSIGAEISFRSDVELGLIGGDAWDRVVIVRYPSRAAFIEMLQSAAYRAASIHADAGVERGLAIVAQDVTVALPPGLEFDPEHAPFPPSPADPVRAVVHLIRYNQIAQYEDGRPTDLTGREAMQLYEATTAAKAVSLGVRPALRMTVEGTLIGDARTWDDARVNLFPSRETFVQLNAVPGRPEDLAHRAAAIDETYALLTLPD